MALDRSCQENPAACSEPPDSRLPSSANQLKINQNTVAASSRLHNIWVRSSNNGNNHSKTSDTGLPRSSDPDTSLPQGDKPYIITHKMEGLCTNTSDVTYHQVTSIYKYKAIIIIHTIHIINTQIITNTYCIQVQSLKINQCDMNK